MRIVEYYSHLNGFEIIQYHKPKLWGEIEKVVRTIDAEKCRTKVSKEKRIKGKILYSPKDMNSEFKLQFEKRKWGESRTSYWVTKDANLFVKHLAFYVGDLIDVGVEILPMKELQSEMSSGVSYYEGELYNLIREGRGVPAVPLVLVGIAP